MRPREPRDTQPSPRRRAGADRQPSVVDLGPVKRASRRVGARTSLQPLSIAILAAALLVAGGAALLLVNRLHTQPHRTLARAPGPREAIIFVLQGVGQTDLSSTPMPAVQQLRQLGVTFTRAWVGQLEPSPPVSNATIGTGSFPRRHGIVGYLWRNPATARVDNPTMPRHVLAGSIDRLIKSAGVPTLSGLLKAVTPRGRILSVAGQGCAAASAAAGPAGDYVICAKRSGRFWVARPVVGHALPGGMTPNVHIPVAVPAPNSPGATIEGWRIGQQDDWVAHVAVDAMARVHPRITIINFPEFGLLARFLPRARRTVVLREVLKGLDSDIAAVVRQSRRQSTFSRTVFVVTSDEGIAPLRSHVSLPTIREGIVAAGGDGLYVTADNGTYIGLRDRVQSQPVAQTLQSAVQGAADAIFYKSHRGAKWLYDAQMLRPALTRGFAGAAKYLLSTFASPRSPDVVIAFKPGSKAGRAVIGRYAETGVGIGFQWNTQHIPLVVAGIGVPRGTSTAFPARLVDIAPTVEALLGIRPRAQDGTPLTDALSGASTSQRRLSQQEQRRIAPFVSALQRRSQSSGG